MLDRQVEVGAVKNYRFEAWEPESMKYYLAEAWEQDGKPEWPASIRIEISRPQLKQILHQLFAQIDDDDVVLDLVGALTEKTKVEP